MPLINNNIGRLKKAFSNALNVTGMMRARPVSNPYDPYISGMRSLGKVTPVPGTEDDFIFGAHQWGSKKKVS